MAIVVAGAATIATSPAGFAASAEAPYQLKLSDERPFDVRRIRIALVPGDRGISRPLLKVGPDWHKEADFPPSLLISVIPGAAKLDFTADARLTYVSATQLPAGATLNLLPAQ